MHITQFDTNIFGKAALEKPPRGKPVLRWELYFFSKCTIQKIRDENQTYLHQQNFSIKDTNCPSNPSINFPRFPCQIRPRPYSWQAVQFGTRARIKCSRTEFNAAVNYLENRAEFTQPYTVLSPRDLCRIKCSVQIRTPRDPCCPSRTSSSKFVPILQQSYWAINAAVHL